MTLIDTNVLLDLLTNDPRWMPWSVTQLRSRSEAGPLLINEIIYAEMAGHVGAESELDAAIGELNIRLDWTPKPALFLAGKAFRKYRRAGGVRSGVLPDFFIGAHAHVARVPVLTRDVGRFRTYFPDVILIAPSAR